VLTILLTIVLIGVILWAVNTYVPMEGNVKNILNVVVIICLVLWLFSALLGVGPGMNLR